MGLCGGKSCAREVSDRWEGEGCGVEGVEGCGVGEEQLPSHVPDVCLVCVNNVALKTETARKKGNSCSWDCGAGFEVGVGAQLGPAVREMLEKGWSVRTVKSEVAGRAARAAWT